MSQLNSSRFLLANVSVGRSILDFFRKPITRELSFSLQQRFNRPTDSSELRTGFGARLIDNTITINLIVGFASSAQPKTDCVCPSPLAS